MPLPDTAVRTTKGKEKPYKLGDGGWLFLLVNLDGKRYWRASYRFAGKQKTLALGAYPPSRSPMPGSSGTRSRSSWHRASIPARPERPGSAAALNSNRTFEAIGREWSALKLPGWVPSYSERLLSRLEADVVPPLGGRPIADIEPPEVLDTIRKVEARGAIELAKCEIQVIGQIFRASPSPPAEPSVIPHRTFAAP